MPSISKLIAVAALVALGGCASNTASRMGDAAATPLSDLGIAKADIPAVLVTARQNPYLKPAAQNCVALALEIRALDDALGADLDTPLLDDDPSLAQRASGAAHDHAVGAVRRTAEGLVPFRGWIRKLSGSEKHSKHVTECVMAGSVRRAYLKGIAAAQECSWRDAANVVAQGG